MKTGRAVDVGDTTVYIEAWNGKSLSSEYISLAFHSKGTIPTTVCVHDCNDTVHMIPITDFHHFIITNKHKLFITSDVSNIFLAVDEMWEEMSKKDTDCKAQYTAAKDAWWELANQGRLRSCAILDMLCRMAIDDTQPEIRTFEAICAEYWDEEDISLLSTSNFEDGLVRRSVMIFQTYQDIYDRGEAVRYLPELLPEAVSKYGLFTETLQVRAVIALEKMNKQGINLDISRVRPLLAEMDKQLAELLEKIRANEECELFNKDEFGNFEYTSDSAKPSINTRKLEAYLGRVLEHITSTYPDRTIDPTLGKGAKFAQWAQYSSLHPFLPVWVSLERIGRQRTYMTSLLGFAGVDDKTVNTSQPKGKKAEKATVHPVYNFVLRNGRASASSPNIQTTPSAPGFRELFVPSDGHVFLVVDYKCIELCTLAAVCESRYGVSILAQTIRGGVDPHSFTAAMFCGIPLEEFQKLQTSGDPAERHKYETFRRHAKAFNFGIAGGEGVHGIQSHALAAYGVNLSLQQAKKFKYQLAYKIYPEISLFLYEDPIQTIARNLRVTPKRCRQNLEWADMANGYSKKGIGRAIGIAKVVRGTPYTKDNTNYSHDFVTKIWSGLKTLTKDHPELAELVEKAAALPQNTCTRCDRTIYGDVCKKCQMSIHDDTQVDPTVYHKKDKSNETVHDILYSKLFGVPCLTLSGRMRGGVNFTQARNTPFSGLAADGAKTALWNLTHIGYRIAAFVHDEFVIEIPNNPETLDSDIQLAVQVIKSSMQEFCGSVPIACTYWQSDRWSKSNPSAGVGSGVSVVEAHEDLVEPHESQ